MKAQISDSIPCGILLALSGGCMDAYSYLFRGRVFANAQTGNILLLGVNLANGDFTLALNYFWPVVAFTAGIIISDVINVKKPQLKVHWRQLAVFVEILILAIVAFLPVSVDFIANALTSFACGIQVESFRKIHGNTITTTMCIGNLRSGTYNLDKYITTHEKPYLCKAVLYFGIISSFVVGAILESWLITYIHRYAIFLSVALLTGALVIMFRVPSGDDGDTFIEG